METDRTPVQIAAAPRKDQLVEHGGKTFKTIQEGKAYILVPPNARTLLDPQAQAKAGDDGSQAQNVFYNPIQQFNRDLSVLAIKAFGEDVCQRKTVRHVAQREKAGKKQDRKRKRTQVRGENDGEELGGGGVKLPKTGDGSPVRVRNGETSTQGAETNARDDAQEDVSNAAESDGAEITNGGLQNGGSEPAPTESTRPEEESASAITAEANGVANENDANTDQPWRPKFRILDALSATGLRALRYASEIPSATAVVANDRDANAVKSIILNVQHNKLTDSITTNTGDALGYMYSVAFPPTHSHGPKHISGKYDVIDLDPYGTAAPFIDASLQALEDGGLLCVTCTDSGVFASCGYSEKTFSLYGGMPIKGSHSHEGGLRLILHSVATSAAKYGMSIEPLLSLSIDFYARLFIRVRRSPQEVKFLAGKTMLVYGCDHGCGAWSKQFIGRHTQQSGKGKHINWKYSIAVAPNTDRLCEHCGSKMHLAGPMWGGPLHNPAFLEKMLVDVQQADPEIYQTKPRIEGMLDTALDELSVSSDTMDFRPAISSFNNNAESGPLIPQVPPEALDHHPFFWIPSALCKVIKAQSPAEHLLKGALRHAGYRVARSHCRGGSIKTDAPWHVVWEILREWVRQKYPVKEGALRVGSPGWKILQGMRNGDGVVNNGDGRVAPAENAEAEANGNGDAGADDDGAASAATSEVIVVARDNAAENCGSGTDRPDTPTKRLEVVFDEVLGRDKPGKRLVRYQMNPRDNWGPMSKAKGQA